MKIQILLSTYNGEKYLEEQIESLRKQVGVNFSILVRDDGSTDNTKLILEEYKEEGILNWYEGENIKPSNSFFNLMQNASQAEYYALCDQDDVWAEDKLLAGIEKIHNCSPDIPSLYFSKAQSVDADLNTIETGKYPRNAYSFGTALLRNNATGCTMIFNNKLLEYINRYTPSYVLMHDHWIYLLCLSLGGYVIYDPVSHIKYRQHGNNVCGSNASIAVRLRYSGFNDKNRIRHKIASELLNNYGKFMTDENRRLTEKVVKYLNSYKDKVSLIFNKEIRTHSLFSDTSLLINIIFNKL